MAHFPPPEEEARRAVALSGSLEEAAPLAPARTVQPPSSHPPDELGSGPAIVPAAGLYQVLYRSHATYPISEGELQDLLTRARAYNAEHQLTGLLLYSDGRFVQLLEGPEPALRALYARIQQDPRHQHVVTVSAGPAPQRRFANWTMGLGRVAGPAVARALHTMLSQEVSLPPELAVPYRRGLLQAFGVVAPSEELA